MASTPVTISVKRVQFSRESSDRYSMNLRVVRGLTGERRALAHRISTSRARLGKVAGMSFRSIQAPTVISTRDAMKTGSVLPVLAARAKDRAGK